MAAWENGLSGRTNNRAGCRIPGLVDRETGVTTSIPLPVIPAGSLPLWTGGKPVVTPVSGSDWPNDRYR